MLFWESNKSRKLRFDASIYMRQGKASTISIPSLRSRDELPAQGLLLSLDTRSENWPVHTATVSACAGFTLRLLTAVGTGNKAQEVQPER